MILIMLAVLASAGKIGRAVEALDIYNYFEAKRLFEKSLKKDETAAAYGLSVIYQRTDNPFSNIDSAYTYIVKSFNAYPSTKAKKKLKYAEYGVDSIAIIQQRSLISSIIYERTRKVHTEEGYQQFISMHPWAIEVDSAIWLRDYLAFEKAEKSGKAEDFQFFLSVYPQSEFAPEANSNYQRALYLEHTFSNSFVSYLDFIRKYPNSPYRPDAEDRIFEIYTETGSKDSYRNFIIEFPDNRNVHQAWKKLYNSHLQEEYSSDKLLEFSAEFPDYPFRDELLEEIRLAEALFYPVKEENAWGFVDSSGRTRVKPVYQSVEWFSEGLAVVRMNDKYGFINKRGQLEIATDFDDALDFREGHAVVEVNEKWGMINRNGEFIIEPHFEDLGILHEGLTYFQNDSGLYGYFDQKGVIRLKPVYDMAYDFINGRAIVSYNNYYGLIDQFGTTYLPFKYQDIMRYGDYLYAVQLNDYWGLISLKGDTILGFDYDYIGPINDNRALIEKDGVYNYMDQEGNLLLGEWLDVYPEHRQLAAFANGFARVKYEKGYNLIDTTGKKLFVKDRENVAGFGSLIAVQKGDNWGYLDHNGNQVIGYNFTQATSFRHKTAIAGNDPFWGLIDKKGEYIIDAKYEMLEFLNDSLLLAKSMGRYGILNTKGDTLLQFVYISIEPLSDLVVKTEEGGQLYYYHLRDKIFIRREE